MRFSIFSTTFKPDVLSETFFGVVVYVPILTNKAEFRNVHDASLKKFIIFSKMET